MRVQRLPRILMRHRAQQKHIDAALQKSDGISLDIGHLRAHRGLHILLGLGHDQIRIDRLLVEVGQVVLAFFVRPSQKSCIRLANIVIGRRGQAEQHVPARRCHVVRGVWARLVPKRVPVRVVNARKLDGRCINQHADDLDERREERLLCKRALALPCTRCSHLERLFAKKDGIAHEVRERT